MSYIELENLCLSYPIYGGDARSLKTSVLSLTTGGRIGKDAKHIRVDALKNISFRLKKGDRLALLGHNGSGKSSLLRVLAGIYPPSSGILDIEGETHSLFDIMLGMDFELSAYANIKLRGIMMGLSPTQIKGIIPDIEEFTDLGSFMKMPIKTYSAGMKVRLAFAIATAIPSDILLIDEVIGAGDATFMQKAKNRLENLIHSSDILVLASHDRDIACQFCNKALLLEKGEMKAFGPIHEVFASLAV